MTVEPVRQVVAPRGVLILVALAAGFVVAFGIRLASGIVGPLFLALVLTIAAFPVRNALVRRGVPPWLGTVAVILAIYLGTVALAVLVVVSGAELAGLLPQYADDLRSLVAGLTDWLAARGVQPPRPRRSSRPSTWDGSRASSRPCWRTSCRS
ncbi:AI-2E family transporter [Terrabacter sp. C0L_2]|uniref:AI-2E family transporter n=1 Tax=Terrabacter sp. C0L_2 TaxID=3108389 RepID=UPI002ED25835|nr:AI-2E family transporter [Terrabacter sp. C0L_2]